MDQVEGGMGRTPVSERTRCSEEVKEDKVRDMNHSDIQFLPC